VTAKLAHRNCA